MLNFSAKIQHHSTMSIYPRRALSSSSLYLFISNSNRLSEQVVHLKGKRIISPFFDLDKFVALNGINATKIFLNFLA